MYIMDVPPLLPTDAQELARRLLEGEDVPTDNRKATAQAIATAVDGIPYYIHHVVDQMKYRNGAVNAATAGEIVSACLTDSQDPWNIRHYRERIDTYYTGDERPFALNLLDALSGAEQSLTFDDLFNQLKSGMVTKDSDSEMVHDMLTLLQRDHYVFQQTDGTYCFRFPMIQRWWRLHRGLAS